MRLSKTPSLILTGFVICIGLIAQDVRAMEGKSPWQQGCQHEETRGG